MTVTSPTVAKDLIVPRTYEADEPDSVFYVHRESRVIWEVQLFPDFALIRPAVSDSSSLISQIDLVSFARDFEEFLGDPAVVKKFLWGAHEPIVEATSKD